MIATVDNRIRTKFGIPIVMRNESIEEILVPYVDSSEHQNHSIEPHFVSLTH
jgi:hypothetical protein